MAEDDVGEKRAETPASGLPGEDHLPGLTTLRAWLKAIGILFALVVINIVMALTTWGWGPIFTIPLTVYLAFLLLRDLIPRNRLPPGRPPQGVPG